MLICEGFFPLWKQRQVSYSLPPNLQVKITGNCSESSRASPRHKIIFLSNPWKGSKSHLLFNLALEYSMYNVQCVWQLNLVWKQEIPGTVSGPMSYLPLLSMHDALACPRNSQTVEQKIWNETQSHSKFTELLSEENRFTSYGRIKVCCSHCNFWHLPTNSSAFFKLQKIRTEPLAARNLINSCFLHRHNTQY